MSVGFCGRARRTGATHGRGKLSKRVGVGAPRHMHVVCKRGDAESDVHAFGRAAAACLGLLRIHEEELQDAVDKEDRLPAVKGHSKPSARALMRARGDADERA